MLTAAAAGCTREEAGSEEPALKPEAGEKVGTGGYHLMTENYPPFNYSGKDGRLTGFSTEVVRQLCRRVGHPGDIELLPWSRAYRRALKEENRILFSTARTEAREDLFRWVGPLAEYQVVFFAWEDRWKPPEGGIRFLEDLKQVGAIGSGQNTSTSQELASAGFENLDLVADSALNAGKLADGRIDLWLSGRLSGIHRAKEQGVDVSQMKVVYEYRKEALYMAFSSQTPDTVVNRWQEALDQLKEEGLYQEILHRYLE